LVLRAIRRALFSFFVFSFTSMYFLLTYLSPSTPGQVAMKPLSINCNLLIDHFCVALPILHIVHFKV
jgi:hypothetical protein